MDKRWKNRNKVEKRWKKGETPGHPRNPPSTLGDSYETREVLGKPENSRKGPLDFGALGKKVKNMWKKGRAKVQRR